VGITEVLFKIKEILTAAAKARHLLRQRPGLIILIDFPEFNLNLAGYARKIGVPVLYYVSPQIWAWRSGRVKTIARRVDHMAVILPFEQNFYHRHKVPATFVGHPLLDGERVEPGPNFEKRFEKNPVVALLPGSRNGEVKKHLPIMLEAAELLARHRADIRFIVSCAASVDPGLFNKILSRCAHPARFEVISGDINRVFSRASFAIAVSGTVTLQTAISGIPLIVIYKVSPLSYCLGKALIRVDHISLVNLIAGKPMIPELIQDEASPPKIAATAAAMLGDIPGLKRLSRDLFHIKNRMGTPGAAERVADIALNILHR
jgi:lipid-A-disaccharide synthase